MNLLLLFQMLALSVLDCILQLDKFSQWLTFISSKGYLQHLVDSLSADDDQLMSVLTGNAENLKILYLFESKMVSCLNVFGKGTEQKFFRLKSITTHGFNTKELNLKPTLLD